MAFIKKSTSPAGGQTLSTSSSTPAELIAQLSAADPLTRRWAARDLLPHPESASALLSQLQSEGDLSVREVILTSLTRMGGAVAVAGLVQCLRSEDAHLRNEAIEAMKALPVEVAPIMGALLVDEDPDVRIMAVNILESLRHPQVEAWLLAVIDNDLVVNVCGTAVDLLGEVGSAASQASLLRLKQRFMDEPYIQFATDLALKRLGEA
jgi:HEAT repeat protein